jgi:DNA-binding response OmpR family regulator
MDTPLRRALIVDDDAALARVFIRCLRAWGWEPDSGPTIGRALSLLKRAPYDLILCDSDLPDGDGVLLAAALRKSFPQLGVIVTSGDPSNLDRARSAGLDLCLAKPFELEDLHALVEADYHALNGKNSAIELRF